MSTKRKTKAQLASRGGVPDGWKLVPIEPTQEMVDRGAEEVDWYAHNARYCYMAMLDAAPQQGGGEDE